MLKNALRDYPLSQAVRHGKCGTCPKILTRFIRAANSAAQTLSREQNRRVQIEILEVISDTVCDPLIASCWRGWCLDNCYLPLSKIRELSWTQQEKRELHRLESELRTLTHYYLK
ncbi:hypothetical protein NBRC116583_26340 [Arenicella sp. 4NH20-0111]|uniref:hypothetical protein n=1 Tax=Arenicella sp. 4NH20-0111 TaxID=3127648 RepID=UPI003106AA47